jgi:hypothetical protein
MPYEGQFKRIDPLHGNLTDVVGVAAIARRARALLTSRSTGEMEAAAQYIDLLLGQAWSEQAASANAASGVIQPPDEDIHEAQVLAEVFNVYEAEENPEFREGQAYEYMAVLALRHAIDASLYIEGVYATRPPWGLTEWPEGSEEMKARIIESHRDPVFRLERTARHALEALEAVCLAERLYRPLAPEMTGLAKQAHLGETIRLADVMAEGRAKKKISAQASINGAKAHTENHRMKEEAFAWYIEHRAEFRYKTNPEAASALIGIVPVRLSTAETWISEFKRKLPPPDNTHI